MELRPGVGPGGRRRKTRRLCVSGRNIRHTRPTAGPRRGLSGRRSHGGFAFPCTVESDPVARRERTFPITPANVPGWACPAKRITPLGPLGPLGPAAPANRTGRSADPDTSGPRERSGASDPSDRSEAVRASSALLPASSDRFQASARQGRGGQTGVSTFRSYGADAFELPRMFPGVVEGEQDPARAGVAVRSGRALSPVTRGIPGAHTSPCCERTPEREAVP